MFVCGYCEILARRDLCVLLLFSRRGVRSCVVFFLLPLLTYQIVVFRTVLAPIISIPIPRCAHVIIWCDDCIVKNKVTVAWGLDLRRGNMCKMSTLCACMRECVLWCYGWCEQIKLYACMKCTPWARKLRCGRGIHFRTPHPISHGGRHSFRL